MNQLTDGLTSFQIASGFTKFMKLEQNLCLHLILLLRLGHHHHHCCWFSPADGSELHQERQSAARLYGKKRHDVILYNLVTKKSNAGMMRPHFGRTY